MKKTKKYIHVNFTIFFFIHAGYENGFNHGYIFFQKAINAVIMVR